MAAFQVTNYDVLADEKPDGRYSLDDYSKHIGNSRFSVLVDMYREAFGMSDSKENDDERQKIIDRIVGVTCHKDVTIAAISKGRFLVKKLGEDKWEVLDDEKSSEVVRQQLSTPVVEEEPLEADGVPSADFGNIDLSDRKRGRRESLLRRSVPESTMLEDKKKTYRMLQGLADENFDIPETAAVTSCSAPITQTIASDGVITSPEGMDVVLASNGRTLSTKGNVIGNNRLEVMLTLQKERYDKSNPAEKEKAATDLVRAVCQYWGGRILVDQGRSYSKSSHEQSVTAMKALLSPESAKPADVPSTPSKPLLSAPPVPEFLRNASAEILKSNGIGGNVQSAAVKSLQQRQAKRVIAKNLGRGIALPDSFPLPNT